MDSTQAKTVLIHLRDRLKKTGAKPCMPVGKPTLSNNDVDGMAFAMAEDLLEEVKGGKSGGKVDAKLAFLYGLVVSRGHATLDELSRYEKTSAPLAS